jgi:hypothetical protein
MSKSEAIQEGFQTGPIECSINPLLSEIVLWNDADICDALQFWQANLPSCLARVAREPYRGFESLSLRHRPGQSAIELGRPAPKSPTNRDLPGE